MPGSPIGEIPVVISGDFSDLSDALSQSVIAAELGGSKIASAFNGAAGSVDEWSQALGKSTNATQADVEAIGKATDKYSQFGTAIDAALGSERDQLDVLQQMPKSYTEMTAAQQRHIETLNEQANASKEAGGALGELTGGAIGFDSALKLLGVTLSAAAVLDFAKSAIETYGAVEKATISIEALTGRVGAANLEVGKLRDLALTDALSFPSILLAEQRFLAFGVATHQIPAALQSIADASAATGRSFDTVANTFERIIESGAVQSRTLINLGINLKDLAAALHTTEDNAQAAFKALDQEQRIQVLNEALGKFKGTAQDVAQGVAGQFQKLKTEFEFFAVDSGKALAPVAGTIAVLGTTALRAADTVAQGFGQVTDSSKHLSDSIGTTAKVVASAHPEFAKLYDQATKAADGVSKADIAAASATSSLTALSPFLAAVATGFEQIAGGLDLVNQKAPDTNKLLAELHQHLSDLAHSSTTSGAAFKAAWEQSQGFANAVNSVHEAQAKANSTLELAKRTLDAYSQSFRDHKPLADGHIATQQEVNRATVDYQKALDGANVKLKEHKQALDDIDKLLKGVDDATRKAYDSVAVYKDIVAAFGKDSLQAAAAEREMLAALKAVGQESADDLAPALMKVSDTFEVFNGHVKALNPAMQELEDKLGHFPTMAQQIAAGFTTIVGHVDQARDAFGFLKPVADDTLKTITADAEGATGALSAFDQATKKAKSDWDAFQASFANDPTTGTAGGGRHKGAGTTFLDLQNSDFNRQFNSGFSIPAHTHIDYSLWGISGARVVPDTGWYYDTFGNLVEADWHILANGGTVPGAGSVPAPAAPVAGISAPAPASTPLAPQVAPQVQSLLDMGYTLDQIVTSTTTLNTTMDNAAATISGSFAALSPVIQQATTQIAASVQQQAASFTRLTDALAPINAPLPTATGTPAAFQRLADARVIGGSNSNSTTVNNMSINLAPDEESLLNQLVTLLQRRGIRT